MKDEEIQNLLGGFATDTLTDSERELLFTAALHNQELFNALAGDQALRELLDDPATRRKLLEALRHEKTGIFERLTLWMRRPASWAVAGSLMTAVVVMIAIRQARPPALPAPTSNSTEVASSANTGLRDAVRPPVALSSPSEPVNAPAVAPKNKIAGRGSPVKIKLAVLDFDSGPVQAKEADRAKDLLVKRLDSSGDYSIIDRKQVDKALQVQNLSRRQLDAPAAARFGRSLGADAVILGSVKPAAESAQKARPVLGGFRQEERQDQSKTTVPQEVQVSATAINTQTAGNLGMAFAQGDQAQPAGLAGAVDQVASSLGQQILQNARVKIVGLVTDVNANVLTLNAGARAGVKVGDRLEVQRAGKPIGRVVIGTVKESFSSGTYEGPAKIGDTVTSQ